MLNFVLSYFFSFFFFLFCCQVSKLKSESCYRFRVTAINRVGNGQPSYPSEEICTLKAKCEGSGCSPLDCQDGENCLNSKGKTVW